jgi:hypothetical protein
MSEHHEYCDGGCKDCEAVIVRTYREYRARGGDDPTAFRVALQVLCLRHPERAPNENAELVSAWIAASLERTASSRLN